MKKIIIGVLSLTLVVPISFISGTEYAEASCSYNGYINSGGKCDKSGKWSREKDDDDDDYDDDRWEKPWRPSSGWGGYDKRDPEEQLAYLRALIVELERLLKNVEGVRGTAGLSIVTETPSDITESSATLESRITFRESDTARVWFQYGTSRSALDRQTNTLTRDESDDRDVEQTITNLRADTLYYVRAVARDEDGRFSYGSVISFRTDSTRTSDTEPDATTGTPTSIQDDRATLRGEVDMNDFENGLVFFVYGESQSLITEIPSEYDRYSAIDEDGDRLQTVRVDGDLDGASSYSETVTDLDAGTRHYVRMCVEYEDEDGDDTLECGRVQSFTTD